MCWSQSTLIKYVRLGSIFRISIIIVGRLYSSVISTALMREHQAGRADTDRNLQQFSLNHRDNHRYKILKNQRVPMVLLNLEKNRSVDQMTTVALAYTFQARLSCLKDYDDSPRRHGRTKTRTNICRDNRMVRFRPQYLVSNDFRHWHQNMISIIFPSHIPSSTFPSHNPTNNSPLSARKP